jgi:2-C-methyl-D-erythritol 2,4-cyclodiphosphate synthase
MDDLRIGLGHDIHAFAEGRELWLGGVKLPHDRGLRGHSDADALIHAIMDALLGAAGLGDIGQLFPDTDPAYRGISSRLLLERVMERIRAAGFKVVNLDTMIHCERPRIGPHRDQMRATLAEILGIEPGLVSIKAGTNEGFDAVGRGEALACQAIVLLRRTGG